MNNKSKPPLPPERPSSIITHQYIEKVRTVNDDLKTRLNDIDSIYAMLLNKNYQSDDFIYQNLYYFDPSIRADFIAVANSGKTATLDFVLDMYVDWVSKIETMIAINAQHYQKNKTIKMQLDEVIDMIIPNAKNATKKGDEFIAKALEQFKANKLS